MAASQFDWKSALGRLATGQNLDTATARAAMADIMAGNASHSQIAAFIVALRIKGETVEEMTGLVSAMRQASITVDVGVPVVDLVGTGGDASGTFNISTTAALIAAAAGAHVAKHGNRSASSLCGSADILEALGVAIDLDPADTAALIREEGFGFLYARSYHPAMRFAAPVRTELGIPTVFNFLGPLTNPAHADGYAVGVSDPAMAEKMIGVLAALGTERAFVFYGEDGLDELTTTGPSYIYRLRAGEITHAEFLPEDFGVERAKPADLKGGSVADNVEITRSVLAGDPGPQLDVCLVNASAALVAADVAEGFVDGVGKARRAVESGAAQNLLDRVVEKSRRLRA